MTPRAANPRLRPGLLAAVDQVGADSPSLGIRWGRAAGRGSGRTRVRGRSGCRSRGRRCRGRPFAVRIGPGSLATERAFLFHGRPVELDLVPQFHADLEIDLGRETVALDSDSASSWPAERPDGGFARSGDALFRGCSTRACPFSCLPSLCLLGFAPARSPIRFASEYELARASNIRNPSTRIPISRPPCPYRAFSVSQSPSAAPCDLSGSPPGHGPLPCPE